MSILLVIAVSACGSSTTDSSDGSEPKQEETTLERVQREGYVTVGFANEAPYAYATTSGELTGEAVEVARAVLKRMGIEEMNGVPYSIWFSYPWVTS